MQLKPTSTTNQLGYWFTLLIICVAYVVGSMPSVILLSFCESPSSDIIQTLQIVYGKNITFVVMMMPWIAIFFSIIVASRYILKWSFSYLFTFRSKIDGKRFLFGFIVWFCISMVTFYTSLNENVVFNFKWQSFLPLILVATITLFIQCTAEELVFRSFIYRWIGTSIPKGFVQVIVSGVLFGLLHGSNPEVATLGNKALLYYIGTGIFLGLLVLLDDGIELSTGFHFANNLFAALIVSKNWQVFQTDALFIDNNPPSFTRIDSIFAFSGQAFFLLVCWIYYKWKPTRKKIF